MTAARAGRQAHEFLVDEPQGSVRVDTLMEQAGTAILDGRVNKQSRPQGNEAHYQLRLTDTGTWSIAKNTIGSCSSGANCSGTLTTLASGTTTAPGLNSWHTLSMTFDNSSISAGIDGRTLGTVTDTSYASGNVGFGVTGYQTNQWDNLSITSGALAAGAIVSGVSGFCAANSGDSSTNGNPIVIATCDGSASQTWTYNSSDQSLRTNGKCADINARGTANNTLVQLWDCNGGSNQKWQVGANSSLVNPASGRCLDDPGSSKVSGTQLIIYDCNGNANQRWTLPS